MFYVDMRMHHGGEKKETIHDFIYILIFLVLIQQVLSIQYLFIDNELEIPYLFTI